MRLWEKEIAKVYNEEMDLTYPMKRFEETKQREL